MDREEILDPLISSIRRGTIHSRYEIIKALEDWEALPIYLDGEHVGGAITKGTEIHIALLPDWRPKGSARRLIRSFLEPLLERSGYLTTRVRRGRASEIEFVQRVGFKPTWMDDQFQYFLLGCLPFERKNP